ncbi:uncharacterized protein METZ01_LOCUS430618 [marine metagenome]|uniref:Uncharacterized protein n=1 Tax=marine metagenome TaxID=408172 RepID=A0A382Y3J9_9ZZZZ
MVLAGGGFRHGEHKVYPGPLLKGAKKPQRLVGKEQRLAEGVSEVPAANLLLSILQSSGLEIDRFGSSTGSLTGLEWS